MSDSDLEVQSDPFPVDCLPGPLASFVSAVAASNDCDPSLVALPVLSVCGAAIGNTGRLRLKNGYDVPPIIWTVVIGESGSCKTPAFDAAMRPLVAMQDHSLREHKAALDLHRSMLKVYRKSLLKWEKLDKDGPPPVEPKEPVAKRYYTSDATVQALAKLLNENPRGLLAAVEEIAHWFGSFDKFTKGAGSDASQYLQLHTAGTLTVDRKNDGTISVPRAALCVMGGVQPGVLTESLTERHRASGMSQRLLKACPPRRRRRWTDDGVGPEDEKAYANLIEGLHSLDFNRTAPEEPTRPHIIELSPEAKVTYVEFVERTREEQFHLTGELAGTWDKLEQYAARFALVFHYIRVVTGDAAAIDQGNFVDGETMQQAVRLAEWFKREAKRVHEMLAPAGRATGSELTEEEAIEIIRANDGKITAKALRDASRKIRGDGAAESLLQRLADSGYGELEPTSRGESVRFVLKT